MDSVTWYIILTFSKLIVEIGCSLFIWSNWLNVITGVHMILGLVMNCVFEMEMFHMGLIIIEIVLLVSLIVIAICEEIYTFFKVMMGVTCFFIGAADVL